MSYNHATICLNGHVISKHDAHAQRYCSKCGAETFSYCPHCNAPIRGLLEIPGVAIIGKRPYDTPYYCYECGSPYPWTEKILNSAIELLALDDELDEATKNLIKTAIPDLMVDTPTTPIATANYKKGISKAGQILTDSLHSLLADAVSETVRKILFP